MNTTEGTSATVVGGSALSEGLGHALVEAMDVYWCTAYAEGQTDATHDTPDGAAQRAMQALTATIAADRRAAVAAERARIADAMRGLVRLLHLPDKPQYPGDERHTEKRMLLALADATVADSWPNNEADRPAVGRSGPAPC